MDVEILEDITKEKNLITHSKSIPINDEALPKEVITEDANVFNNTIILEHPSSEENSIDFNNAFKKKLIEDSDCSNLKKLNDSSIENKKNLFILNKVHENDKTNNLSKNNNTCSFISFSQQKYDLKDSCADIVSKKLNLESNINECLDSDSSLSQTDQILEEISKKNNEIITIDDETLPKEVITENPSVLNDTIILEHPSSEENSIDSNNSLKRKLIEDYDQDSSYLKKLKVTEEYKLFPIEDNKSLLGEDNILNKLTVNANDKTNNLSKNDNDKSNKISKSCNLNTDKHITDSCNFNTDMTISLNSSSQQKSPTKTSYADLVLKKLNLDANVSESEDSDSSLSQRTKLNDETILGKSLLSQRGSSITSVSDLPDTDNLQNSSNFMNGDVAHDEIYSNDASSVDERCQQDDASSHDFNPIINNVYTTKESDFQSSEIGSEDSMGHRSASDIYIGKGYSYTMYHFRCHVCQVSFDSDKNLMIHNRSPIHYKTIMAAKNYLDSQVYPQQSNEQSNNAAASYQNYFAYNKNKLLENKSNIKIGNKLEGKNTTIPVKYIPLNLFNRKIIIFGDLYKDENLNNMDSYKWDRYKKKKTQGELPIIMVPYQVRVSCGDETNLITMYAPHIDQGTSTKLLKECLNTPENSWVGDVVDPVEGELKVSFNNPRSKVYNEIKVNEVFSSTPTYDSSLNESSENYDVTENKEEFFMKKLGLTSVKSLPSTNKKIENNQFNKFSFNSCVDSFKNSSITGGFQGTKYLQKTSPFMTHIPKDSYLACQKYLRTDKKVARNNYLKPKSKIFSPPKSKIINKISSSKVNSPPKSKQLSPKKKQVYTTSSIINKMITNPSPGVPNSVKIKPYQFKQLKIPVLKLNRIDRKMDVYGNNIELLEKYASDVRLPTKHDLDLYYSLEENAKLIAELLSDVTNPNNSLDGYSHVKCNVSDNKNSPPKIHKGTINDINAADQVDLFTTRENVCEVTFDQFGSVYSPNKSNSRQVPKCFYYVKKIEEATEGYITNVTHDESSDEESLSSDENGNDYINLLNDLEENSAEKHLEQLDDKLKTPEKKPTIIKNVIEDKLRITKLLKVLKGNSLDNKKATSPRSKNVLNKSVKKESSILKDYIKKHSIEMSPKEKTKIQLDKELFGGSILKVKSNSLNQSIIKTKDVLKKADPSKELLNKIKIEDIDSDFKYANRMKVSHRLFKTQKSELDFNSDSEVKLSNELCKPRNVEINRDSSTPKVVEITSNPRPPPKKIEILNVLETPKGNFDISSKQIIPGNKITVTTSSHSERVKNDISDDNNKIILRTNSSNKKNETIVPAKVIVKTRQLSDNDSEKLKRTSRESTPKDTPKVVVLRNQTAYSGSYSEETLNHWNLPDKDHTVNLGDARNSDDDDDCLNDLREHSTTVESLDDSEVDKWPDNFSDSVPEQDDDYAKLLHDY